MTAVAPENEVNAIRAYSLVQQLKNKAYAATVRKEMKIALAADPSFRARVSWPKAT